MSFEKGKPKTGGRAKGTPNTVSKELRDRIRKLLESQFDKVAANLEALEPKEQINAWLKMAEFVLPKLQRTETIIDISKLNDEEVDDLLERALTKMGQQ